MRWFGTIGLMFATALMWPLPLGAQQPATPTIGVLSSSSSEARRNDQFAAFEQGLKKAGYVDGRNVKVEYRWANDNYTQLAAFAAELVTLKVAVIVAAGGSISAITAHKATRQIPIVFTTVADPVAAGLVASLNRPGGNATGTAGLTSELDPKRLELLHQLKPKSKVVGVLANPKRPGLDRQRRDLEETARQLKVELREYGASTDSGIDDAFGAMARDKIDALLVRADPFFNNRREQVIAQAAKSRVAAIYQWREFAAAGGLLSYGPSITEAYYQAGINAGRILNGVAPSEIPVVQPARFEMVINMKAAKALDLEISRLFLLRADAIID